MKILINPKQTKVKQKIFIFYLDITKKFEFDNKKEKLYQHYFPSENI